MFHSFINPCQETLLNNGVYDVILSQIVFQMYGNHFMPTADVRAMGQKLLGDCLSSPFSTNFIVASAQTQKLSNLPVVFLKKSVTRKRWMDDFFFRWWYEVPSSHGANLDDLLLSIFLINPWVTADWSNGFSSSGSGNGITSYPQS